MFGEIKVPKFYEWVFWHYDGSIFTQYMPESPDPQIFERLLNEIKDYHNKVSKVKRAGWVAISIEKAYRINLKAGYTEAVAKSLPPLFTECHGEFPFITRRLDIRYHGARAGDHEYYYVLGIKSGRKEDIIEHMEDDKLKLTEHVNGRFSIVDKVGATRHDSTSELVPALPPETGDTMRQVIKDIKLNTNILKN